jgi:4,5-DOPA dioxygenase extradiol
MASSGLPALFIGHGAPTLILEEDEFTRSLREFAERLPAPPRAIVVVSSNWTTEAHVEVTANAHPPIQHDFSGFQPELYEMTYPCPGLPELSLEIVSLLGAALIRAELTGTHALDYGAWMPLRIAFPEARVPVIQVSLPEALGPEGAFNLGRALAPLRSQGVLLVGSGGAVYNRERIVWHKKYGAAPSWGLAFESWLKKCLWSWDLESLMEFEERGPSAGLAQPTPEQLYPLFFVLGSRGAGEELGTLFEGFSYEALSLFSFALSGAPVEARRA